MAAGVKSDINITPLVDVVLVLLIIFMVVTPILQMGYEVQVPPKVESAVPQPTSDQVIVRMDLDGKHLHQQAVGPAQRVRRARLQDTLRGRQTRVIFFAADGELPYDQVADFMDLCRHNGADNLGIVFEDMKATG